MSDRQQDSLSSTSTSLSLIKLDELSSFGASKQNRLPTLIKVNELSDNKEHAEREKLEPKQINSMPVFTDDRTEQVMSSETKQQVSLPANLELNDQSAAGGDQRKDPSDKENRQQATNEDFEDFQLVDMVGPSLPQPDKISTEHQVDQSEQEAERSANIAQFSSQSSVQQHPLNAGQQLLSHPGNIGDSLIEMIINLRNENQNLVRALEANNDYVKERINEFKRANEEAKKREAQFALERADHEHQSRKLKRQNAVLSERLKSLEIKLNSMKLEVNESLDAARSSKASSDVPEEQQRQQLYPNLTDEDSFSNNQATTMQIDGTNQELLNDDSRDESPRRPTAPLMDADVRQVSNMTKEELSERFEANKAEFYTLDDPMKQCDRLEKQLNDIGKRDYEICLLQQQLNIYRQDFRLERMEKLEAKIQIEKLKNDIDRLCLERLNEQSSIPKELPPMSRGSHHRRSGGFGVKFDPAMAADAVVGKLGLHMSKKAAKSAAKAAKYAAKQAHREEKIAAAASRAPGESSCGADQSHHRRGHHHARHHHSRAGGIRSEVVNDLLSTANKAMLTGYKMASTHVNLALDKLSQYEQQQAANLAANKPPSAPSQPINHPSLD